MFNKPVSSNSYMKRYKMVTIAIIITIVLSISVTYLVNVIFDSNKDFYRRTIADPFNYFTVLIIDNDGQGDAPLPNEVMNSISAHYRMFNVFNLFGRTEGAVFYVNETDMETLFTSLDMRLVRGRMPSGMDEIIIPSQWAKNQNVSIGDIVRLSYNTLNAIVVGITESPSGEIGLGFLSDEEVNRYILLNSEIDLPQIKQMFAGNNNVIVSDFQRRLNFYNSGYAFIFTFSAVFIGLVLAATCCVSISSILDVNMESRNNDLTLLYSLGWEKSKLKKYLFSETVLFMLWGGIISVFVGAAANIMLYKYLLSPLGSSSISFSLQGIVSCVALIIITLGIIRYKQNRYVNKSINANNLLEEL